MNRTACLCRCLLFIVVSGCALLLPGIADATPPSSRALKDLSPEFTASDSFASHLPILVLESSAEDASTAQLSVYSGAGSVNSLLDEPAVTAEVSVGRDATNALPGKTSFRLALAAADEGVFARKLSLAGLPGNTAWTLQGSSQDKGMLRTGLAYALGREIFPDHTPETRYCEVFFKRGGILHYEGLFILAESAAHRFQVRNAGPEAILLRYAPADNSRHGGARANDDAVFGRSLEDRGFSSVYPQSGDSVLASRMETTIDDFEQTLSSLNPSTFLKYRTMLDQDSVINLLVLNAVLLNAHGSQIPFYLARDDAGRLAVMPEWRFDAAIDNSPVRPRPLPCEVKAPEIPPLPILARRVPVWRQLEDGDTFRSLRLYPIYEIMDGDSFLWLDKLFLSRPFLMDLFARYHELRRGPLSPENTGLLVDALAEQLGGALERDWKRWEQEYTATEGPLALLPYTDGDGETRIRRTESSQEELVKIRYSLLMQDTFLLSQISQLDWLSSDLFDEASSGNDRAGYALVTIVAFLLLTHMLARKL